MFACLDLDMRVVCSPIGVIFFLKLDGIADHKDVQLFNIIVSCYTPIQNYLS